MIFMPYTAAVAKSIAQSKHNYRKSLIFHCKVTFIKIKHKKIMIMYIYYNILIVTGKGYLLSFNTKKCFARKFNSCIRKYSLI